jgi:hypothetical protein
MGGPGGTAGTYGEEGVAGTAGLPGVPGSGGWGIQVIFWADFILRPIKVHPVVHPVFSGSDFINVISYGYGGLESIIFYVSLK